MNKDNTIKIWFDGGCKTNPGRKYGSFRAELRGNSIQKSTFPLGWGTNNEAELESLAFALKNILERFNVKMLDPKNFALAIFTDSTIVRNWANRVAKQFATGRVLKAYKNDRKQAMYLLALENHDLLESFGSWEISWNSRDVNVEKFGH